MRIILKVQPQFQIPSLFAVSGLLIQYTHTKHT